MKQRKCGRGWSTVVGLAALLGVLAGAAAPRGAAAQTTDSELEARRLFEEGVGALEREDYATALVAFQRARELSSRPILVYNIGMCQRALLRFPEAIDSFRQFLVEAGRDASDEQRRQVVELIAEMEANLSQISVRVNIDGALLFLDGQQVGSTPLVQPLRVGAGSHVLEARRQGYRDARVPFDVMAGESTQVQLVLEALPVTAPVGPPEEETSVVESWWFWTILGALVVGGAVTAGVLLWPEDPPPDANWTIVGW
ncbi:MAG: PEGA domain-containing protein [Deltaproteobacteria bacterium]|nr:PEGA domain-containing protein [Deltaproteobacteria bacterium]